MTIWKFTITSHASTVLMPIGAEILSIQEQNGNPQIWAKIDPEATVEARAFILYGTGQKIGDAPQKYLATVQLGALVFHVFERL